MDEKCTHTIIISFSVNVGTGFGACTVDLADSRARRLNSWDKKHMYVLVQAMSRLVHKDALIW